MSDFNFTHEDLDSAMRVAEQIHKDVPPDGLKTSRSADPRGDPTDNTLFTLSDILMRTPAMKSQAEIEALIQARVHTGMGTIVDELGNVPMVGDLLPEGMLEEFGVDPNQPQGAGVSAYDGDYPPGTSKFVRALISNAKAEIGYTETPPSSNRNKFAGPAGVANGYAWCATFIMAMCKKSGMSQGKLLTPGTELTYDNYNKAGRLNKEPKPGAFALFNYKSGRRVSHIAITVGVEGDRIITIDGNTSASDKGSQDNGGMVAEKIRKLSDVVAFCHPVFPEVEESPTSSGSGSSQSISGFTSSGSWSKPISTKVNFGYGWRTDPISGNRDHHYGIDYDGSIGTPIHAAKDGKVVHAGNFVGEVANGVNGDYGLMIEIEHGDGYRTRYGHMSAFAVGVGDMVKTGQRIGDVGNTGRSTGPHLHFEVRRDGAPINPSNVGI